MCGACKDKDSQCTFSSLPGLTRTAALKSEVSQLKTNNGSLIELYWQLKYGSASDAHAIVEQIRSEERTIDVPSPTGPVQMGVHRALNGRSDSIISSSDTAYSHSRQQPASEYGMANNPENNSESCRGVPLSSLRDLKARESHSRESASAITDASAGRSLSQTSWTGSHLAPQHRGGQYALLRQSLQSNMNIIRKGFGIQRLLASEVFYCYEPEAFDELFRNLDMDTESRIGSPMLCEMCAVAVTSGQYVRDSIEPGLLDYWYGMCPSACTPYLAEGKTESFQMPRDNSSMTA